MGIIAERNFAGQLFHEDMEEEGRKGLWWCPLFIIGSILYFYFMVGSLRYGLLLAIFPAFVSIVLIYGLGVHRRGRIVNAIVESIDIEEGFFTARTMPFLFFKPQVIRAGIGEARLVENSYDLPGYPENCKIKVTTEEGAKELFLVRDFFHDQWDEIIESLTNTRS